MAVKELLHACPVGVAIVSADLERKLYANEKLAKLFGAETPESFLLVREEDTWCDETRFSSLKEYMQSGQEVVNYVAKRRKLDGSTLWISMNSQIAEVDGIVARILWMTDVTELVEMMKEQTTAPQALSA